jgi:predicted XRE-type DNA-binding protein
MPKILSKSAFATQLGVSRSRVSQWLAQNKLHGAALVGTGPRARIRVDIAVEQLKRSLDLSQRLGANGRSRLDVKNEPGSPDATSDGTVEERIKVERLQQLALANEKAREERAARGGRYVLVDDVKQQMGRISSQMLNSFEGWQGEVASIIAGKFNLPHREVSHLTRSEFRTFRSRASEALRQQMQEIAEFIEDDLPESEPSGDDAGS